MKVMVVIGEYPAEEENGASKPCSNARYRERISTVTGAHMSCGFFEESGENAARQRHFRASEVFFSPVISLGLETRTRLADPLGAQLRLV